MFILHCALMRLHMCHNVKMVALLLWVSALELRYTADQIGSKQDLIVCLEKNLTMFIGICCALKTRCSLVLLFLLWSPATSSGSFTALPKQACT